MEIINILEEEQRRKDYYEDRKEYTANYEGYDEEDQEDKDNQDQDTYEDEDEW